MPRKCDETYLLTRVDICFRGSDGHAPCRQDKSELDECDEEAHDEETEQVLVDERPRCICRGADREGSPRVRGALAGIYGIPLAVVPCAAPGTMTERERERK